MSRNTPPPPIIPSPREATAYTYLSPALGAHTTNSYTPASYVARVFSVAFCTKEIPSASTTGARSRVCAAASNARAPVFSIARRYVASTTSSACNTWYPSARCVFLIPSLVFSTNTSGTDAMRANMYALTATRDAEKCISKSF